MRIFYPPFEMSQKLDWKTTHICNAPILILLNRLIDPNPNPLIIGISTTMQMQTIKTKPAEIRFHSKRPHTVTTEYFIPLSK
jgi:hypothetical protein